MKFLADMGISPKTVDYIFRLRNMHPTQVNSYLHGVLSQHPGVLEHGAVVSVSEGQIRIRTLPIIADGQDPGSVIARRG